MPAFAGIDIGSATTKTVILDDSQTVLASTDPVAIDQASMDLIEKAEPLPGYDHDHGDHPGGTLGRIHGVDWTPILSHAARIGLGSRSYELVELG